MSRLISSRILVQTPAPSRNSQSDSKRPVREKPPEAHPDEVSLDICFRFGRQQPPTIAEICSVAKHVVEVTQFHAATSPTSPDVIHIRLPIPACDRVVGILSDALSESGIPSGLAVKQGETEEHVRISWNERGRLERVRLPASR